ncbi:MAG: SusC/RagA family TonB-linked outer membrane protein [Bacteroidales bacterium]|nr:SusC/RagA family TonB-linked outer membrane protein [Bacteroidales bacterium]MDE7128624.1 SusC/RagA family TonB-linked outer membrane protein [Bacteroidales bacterium]
MLKFSFRRRLLCLLGCFIMCPVLFSTVSRADTGHVQQAPVSLADETTPPNINISGTVTDIKGEPLIGVSILEKGTVNGAVTDIDGKFTLSVSAGAQIEVSCIGFTPKTLTVTSGTPLTIVLEEDSELLNEVVVTALGIKREQKALSYNVQEVKGDKLTAVKDANFINSLQGKVAGAIVNTSAAGPGAAARIIMRGTKSLEKDDNALYVIDGIPMFNINSGDNSGGTMNDQPGTNSVADINPEDIESLTILTGPSAAALYGSEAANGVILITTKKGSEGKMKVSYSNSTSFSTPLMMPQFQTRYANAEGSQYSWGPALSTPSTYNPADFFNTGVNEINGLTFTCGTEKNQTYASVSTTNSTGILPNNTYNRYNFSFRNTTKFAKDKLTLDVGGQYIIQNNKNMVGSGLYFNPLTSLYLFPRGESFQEVQAFERWNETRGIMEQYWPEAIFGSDYDMQNPYWIMYRMQNKLKKRRYMMNASLKWDVTQWLNIAARIRVDNSDQDIYAERYATTTGTFTEGSDRGFYNHTKQNDRTVYGDVIASISKNFVDDRLSINANIGASFNDMREDVMYFKGGLEQIPNFFHYGNIKLSTSKRNETAWHDQTQSVFASFEAGWDRMVYLTLTGRNDWDSRLAFTDKPYYFYPSTGLSFVISELFDSPVAVPYLKVRASWSEVASAPERYLTRKQYTYNEQTNLYEYPSVHYDTNLKPENTRSWELGLNAKFYESRFNLDLTFYRSNTFNQTFYVDASSSSGYKQNIVQTGNIQNQGIEAAVGYTDSYSAGKVKFSTNFTFTMNDNKIIRLANGAINPENGEVIEMDYYPKGTLGISGGPALRLTEGGTMGDLYINQRLRQSPNGYIYANATNDIELETTEYRKIGSLLAKCHVGWNTSLSYAGVNLNVQFTGRFGGLVVSDTQALLDKYGVSEASAAARDAGGVSIGEGRVVDAQKYYDKVTSAIGTYYTYDATNVRLSELSVSYTLPGKWFKDKVGLTVGLTGKNLWMIYCKAPFDPESTASVTNNFYQGVDLFQQPSLRSLGFNVKLSF